MIELVDAAIGAAGVGAVGAVVAVRRFMASRRAELARRQDERAQVIAIGYGMGIEYVPGEYWDNFVNTVRIERDKRAEVAHRAWKDEQERERDNRRRAEWKGTIR